MWGMLESMERVRIVPGARGHSLLAGPFTSGQPVPALTSSFSASPTPPHLPLHPITQHTPGAVLWRGRTPVSLSSPCSLPEASDLQPALVALLVGPPPQRVPSG